MLAPAPGPRPAAPAPPRRRHPDDVAAEGLGLQEDLLHRVPEPHDALHRDPLELDLDGPQVIHPLRLQAFHLLVQIGDHLPPPPPAPGRSIPWSRWATPCPVSPTGACGSGATWSRRTVAPAPRAASATIGTIDSASGETSSGTRSRFAMVYPSPAAAPGDAPPKLCSTASRSNGPRSPMEAAKWRSAVRTPSGMRGYQRGWAITSARPA